jgi:hypothetical protein
VSCSWTERGIWYLHFCWHCCNPKPGDQNSIESSQHTIQ